MTLTFHLLDAIQQDKRSEDETSYTILLFGSTAEGTPVRLEITGFQPFFYVELPDVKDAYYDFLERIQEEIREQEARLPEDSFAYEVCSKAPMYGYSGGKQMNLVKISCKSRKAFYAIKKILLDDRSRPQLILYHDSDPLKVFDAALDPMLRFFHLRNLQPCGWVSVECEYDEDTTIDVSCPWDSISPCAKPPMASAPFKMNFWDIECYSSSGDFPIAAKGDPIIQIGNVIVQQGKPTKKVIFVLGDCDPVANATEPVRSFKTEKAMLQAWAKWMVEEDPDVLVGYNIFGFDEKYLWERAKAFGLVNEDRTLYDRGDAIYGWNTFDENFRNLSRLNEGNNAMKLETKFLSSSALGDNFLYMWNTIGRLQVDLYHYIRRSASLPSYKLDSVCQYYMSGKLSSVDTTNSKEWILKTKQTGDVQPGRFVVLLDETGEALTEKLKVIRVDAGKAVVVEADSDEDMDEAVKWAVVKDDCPPAEIFRLHREGGPAGRAYVAQYCIQDCDLVYELYKKLDVFNNAMSMANVCSVPVSYIFTRGQGIKIESLIFKECDERGIVVEVQETPARNPKESDGEVEEEEKEDSYEGAIVLDPVPGFYTQSPIGVCDFASLYPSTIISENISHDSLVWVKDFDLNGKLVAIPFGSVADEANAPSGTRFTDIDFDIWRADPNDKRAQPEKLRVGTRVCRYAQKPDNSKHTLPDIVAKLLAARKSKRKEAEKEEDPFRKALLDAEQLAYKLTANSLYGQLGSSTFKIRLQHLAASTTAYGRKQILFAKAAIEKFYGPEAKDPRCSASIVYGDTDSLFVDFGVKDPATGELLSGTAAVEATMHITEEAGKFITKALKPPHDFEYDKVFDQFIIFSKKRYVGNKYEESATDFKQTSMGIVLKRRDNAPVLKTIYGGAIKILLNERDVAKAAQFVSDKTLDMVQGKMSLSQLTITKSLSAKYKPDYIKGDIQELEKQIKEKTEEVEKLEKRTRLSDRDAKQKQILEANIQALYGRLATKREDLTRFTYPAHKVLADRMAKRDPGNAPASGERLGFVYIAPPTGQLAPKLQGDRIETPDYIKEKKLQPDYKYYIEHQLMKPIGQLFGLMVEQIPGYTPSDRVLSEGEKEVVAIELLFKRALNECDKVARRSFVANQFGFQPAPLVQASYGGNYLVQPTDARRSPRLAEKEAPKVQTTLNRYMLHKEIIKQYEDVKAKTKDELKKGDPKTDNNKKKKKK
jgi:DNA polymerase elongation subunit (family B)